MNINFKSCLSSIKIVVLVSIILFSCNNSNNSTKGGNNKSDSLTEEQKHLPENALKGLVVVAKGLEVQVVATEPMLKNPTNIDVDERGRVWVTEAYNYRPAINGYPINPEGDRIIILEDRDGDGKADTAKVFYQGPEINAPLGICVLGNMVLVSQSPFVWAFYDDNGDDKADRKEIFFEGIGGEQHDHAIHTFTFGPDGKLYFNMGNAAKTLKDKNGKTVLDQDGKEISPQNYKEGMVFRCDKDGSHVECLGQNFRNPYEVAVDSYGTLWQSDNDDDGNRGVRINYVMDYGNYGYTDEMTGAGWRENRINLEDSIPLRHWHLNDPGSVPNLLQTGAGSPTGMVNYEGSLLPEQFHNQIIHCDPGPNVIRSYPVKKNGAGYTAEIVNILEGDNDRWFRPSDVCVAPDGSLIVADWYDVGVGGHRAGDRVRGRIYRIAPTGSKYTIPTQDYSTPDGAVVALQSPNLSVRYHAFTALQTMGKNAIPALEKLWNSSPNPRMRARAFWALVKMPENNAQQYIQQAIKQGNPDLRIVALRAARELKADVTGVVSQLVNDPDAQVRRECALALHHNKAPEAAQLWATLATEHDGKDRWYLEALGIGADDQWDNFFAAYLSKVKDPLQTEASRDIVWRSRTDKAIPFLSILASDANVPMKSRLRYFRAFDFIPGSVKTITLIRLLKENNNKDIEMSSNILRLLDAKDAVNSPVVASAIKNVLKSYSGKTEYLNLIRKYGINTEGAKILDIVITNGSDALGVDAARLLFELKDGKRFRDLIKNKEINKTLNVLAALGIVGNTESIEILSDVALSKSYSQPIREKAVEMIGKSRVGASHVLELLRNKKLPSDLISFAVSGLSENRNPAIYEEAKTFLPGASKAQPDKEGLTENFKELSALTGNAVKGRAIYNRTCSVCHQANGQGFDFGPNLSEIGSKYPKEGLFDAIVRPSAGISFGYETWQINLKDGSELLGIISSRTEKDIELKYPGGATQKIKTADVKLIKALPGSMMTENLNQTMTKQEFSDLLEYLSSLKKK
jgi:putative membrane-bound dehydrogenase-like protein